MSAAKVRESSLKIFILSYGIAGHDGRLQELINLAGLLGPVELLCFSLGDRGPIGVSTWHSIRIDRRSARSSVGTYLRYVLETIRLGWRRRNIDILIVDDFSASVAAHIWCRLFRPKVVVQDAREFNFGRRLPGLGKVLIYFEARLFRRADVIIAANNIRAKLMKVLYKLPEIPLVFENVRRLPLPPPERLKQLQEKFAFVRARNTVNVISTGGCSVARGTVDLVKAFKHLPGFHLYIVGQGSARDYGQISKIIETERISNVTILDRMPLDELAVLVGLCDIGVVEYHQNDLNNMFCASGKVYEYAFSGLPVVTTDNPPLQELCRKYQIGVAGSNFVDSIKEVASNLSVYKARVKAFCDMISVESYRLEVGQKLLDRIREKIADTV